MLFLYLGEDKLKVSKYADNLVQLDTGYTISPNPKLWKCYDSGMTENLWLNLSTGVIGSGRRNFDGSGGTGAALKHFEETGKKYPLVVKLGTITPNGADVYSYADDENDMVEDPKLAEHLAHWGINMMQMKKTEKTIAELDIDLNMQYDFSNISEEGVVKTPLHGPGFIGLRNLGNSCYCNTVYQVLFSTHPFIERYAKPANQTFFNVDQYQTPAKDLTIQLSKLGVGLTTNRYESQGSISPQMIKNLLGENHVAFSTNQQQDALEYFQHILTRIERADTARRETALDITKHFRFEVETRFQCDQSKQVRYTYNEANSLSLGIPLESATNHAAVQEFEKKLKSEDFDKSTTPLVRLNIPFESVLENFLATEIIGDFKSPATGQNGTASKTVRLKSFPNFLMVHLCRYVLGDNWTPKKLDADIFVPEKISLECLRGTGKQDNEVELPEGNGSSGANSIQPDENILQQLLEFGFSKNACIRAALAVNNASLELASEWLMNHLEDANINDPVESASSSNGVAVNEEHLQMLCGMGIDIAHARKGLQETSNDIDRALDWCFNHNPDDVIMEDAGREPQASSFPTGKSDYELKAIISHIGGNINSGHYVCHIKKDGKWALYNDSKVSFNLCTSFWSNFNFFLGL